MAYDDENEGIVGFSDMDFIDPNTETSKEEIDSFVDRQDFPRFLFGKHWHDPEMLREHLYAKNSVAKKRGPGRPRAGDASEVEA